MEAVKHVQDLPVSAQSTVDIHAWKQQCYDAMNDDFNSPILIAHLFEGVRIVNVIKEGKEQINAADLALFTSLLHAFVFEVLGLESTNIMAANNDKLEGVVSMLIQMRNEARANKDFAMSDHIRDELAKLNIQLKDGKEGTSFSL